MFAYVCESDKCEQLVFLLVQRCTANRCVVGYLINICCFVCLIKSA